LTSDSDTHMILTLFWYNSRLGRNQLGPAICPMIADMVMHNDTLELIE